jgi:hypothetical protein
MNLPEVPTTQDFPVKRWLWLAVIVLAFALGLAVRLYDFSDPPLDFHPTRQLHSAIIARGMVYQTLADAPEWQRERAYNQWQAEGLIEPQIMERLTAMTYGVIGSEQLWAARLWAILFWMAGGVFLGLLAEKISGLAGAAFALAYYLLWPYAVIASRAFQPEPLKVAMIITGLWAATHWMEKRTWKWAAATGILCGLAIYVKATAVFFIAPALAGLILSAMPFSKAVLDKQVWAVFILSITPYIAYHIFGMYILGSLGEQFGLRFFPNLWQDPAFYVRWLGELNRVAGLEIFLAAAVGLLLFAARPYTGMLAGLLAGYLLYGFTFAYHISTHDYYHMPLFVMVPLGLALLVQGMLAGLRVSKRETTQIILCAALVFFMLIKAWDVRVTLKRADYRNETRFWEKLGAELGPDKKVTGLLADYGYRLSYWGWMNVSPWMATADIGLRELAGETVDYQEALEDTLSANDYFIVTQMDEFARQEGLEEYLRSRFGILRENNEVIIFDLGEKIQGE